MKAITLEPISRIEGEINLPGSKSLSNRALLLAALAKGTTTVTNLLDSDDISPYVKRPQSFRGELPTI